MPPVRRTKGRDPRQKKTWETNKQTILSVLRAHPWEYFSAASLARQTGLSIPTVRKHLHQLANARIVEAAPNGGWRMIRPLWPIPDELIAGLGHGVDSFPINDLKPVSLTLGSEDTDKAYELTLEKRPGILEVKRTFKLHFNEALNTGETPAIS